MDYKYIEQLLERYWDAETSMEEERILRAFFSQETVPAHLQHLRPLFTAADDEVLGDDFDARMLAMVNDDRPAVTARRVTLTQRLMPLFKAAAIVAILLTLGNAAQAPWNYGWDDPKDEYAKFHKQQTDTVNMLTPIQADADTVAVPKGEEAKYYE
jgi:hypothetical protein